MEQYKTYTASEIKNSLTKIFIDAAREPVVITRRGSEPYILLSETHYKKLGGENFNANEELPAKEDTGTSLHSNYSNELDQLLLEIKSSVKKGITKPVPKRSVQAVNPQAYKNESFGKKLNYYVFQKHYN